MARKWEPAGDPSRRLRKMARIDSLTPSQRAAVHDVGWGLVKEFIEAGVTDGKTIRRLVKMCWHETTHGKLDKQA